MTTSNEARSFRPAARLLALIMAFSLIVLGVAGLIWHLLGRTGWLFGENIGIDVFQIVMGLLALGAGGSQRSAKAYGRFALVVFLVATVLSGAGVLMHETHIPGPHWLAHNTLGFTEVNYIVFLLMTLWSLQLSKTSPDVDPWGSGDSHAALRALPDREDAVAEASRKQLTA